MNKIPNRRYERQDQIFRAYGYETDFARETCRQVTIQVTENCPLECTYCFQINKHKQRNMTKETARKIVDLLFKMYDEDNPIYPITKKTKAIIFDFIGGEEFANVEVMDEFISYFIKRCIELDHPWLTTLRCGMASNGVLYFTPEVQKFLNKYQDFLSVTISLDGPKELHDSCRVFPDGSGSFDVAYRAFKDAVVRFKSGATTKVTLCKSNLKYLNTILEFFYSHGLKYIHANVVFEDKWDYEDAKVYYNELKKLADTLLEHDDLDTALFVDHFFAPIEEDAIGDWCGGAGQMLAFTTDGTAYPCIRYAESSMGCDCDSSQFCIGDCNGIYATDKQKEFRETLLSINRRSKSDDECFYCPIASGCADCEAWNFQSCGEFGHKSKNICTMHKARSLANAYYWNTYYKKYNINKKFKIYLPKEEALKIISEEEYNMLDEVQR